MSSISNHSKRIVIEFSGAFEGDEKYRAMIPFSCIAVLDSEPDPSINEGFVSVCIEPMYVPPHWMPTEFLAEAQSQAEEKFREMLSGGKTVSEPDADYAYDERKSA